MIITVSGPPGSGKSTLAKALAEKLGFAYFCAGEIFRAEAKARSLSLEEFGKLAEQDWEIDRELDRRLVDEMSKAQRCVFDARLAGVLAFVHGIPAFKIYVTASAEERARRIAGREGKSFEEVLREMLAREESETKRYKAIYGYDYTNKEIYDLYIESTAMNALQVLEYVLKQLPNLNSLF